MKRFMIIFALLLVSCTPYPKFESKVPGLFTLINGSSYVRIEEISCSPNEIDLLSTISGGKDVFLFYPIESVEAVKLINVQTDEVIEIIVEPVDDGFYVIKHDEPLPLGFYCLEISEKRNDTGEYPQWGMSVE